MTVDPLEPQSARTMALLRRSGFPATVDTNVFVALCKDIDAMLPEVFGKIEDRLHSGGFPVVTLSEIQEIFASHDRLRNIPEIAILAMVKCVIPYAYPGTGFNLVVSPIEISVSRYGSPGPAPASVRKAGTSMQEAASFLTGRASTNAKLYYLHNRLNALYPGVSIDDPYFDLPNLQVKTVLQFFELISVAMKEVEARVQAGKTTFDLTQFVASNECKAFLGIARPASQVGHFDQNHRLISLLIEPGTTQDAAAFKAGQFFGLIAINLYDLLHTTRRVLCLPLNPQWQSGDRLLHIGM